MAILRKRWVFFVVLIIVLGFIFFPKNTSEVKSEKEKNTYTVKRDTIEDELSLSGEIEAEEHVTLRFQSSGRLSWVGVKEGDFVKKYQAVASLDQREVEKNLKKYLNTFVSERLDFDQEVQDTQIRNIGNLSEDARREALRVLDQAQYDLNNAIIDVELKKLAIEFSNLYSPIDGLVVKMGSPYAGVNVTPTQAEIEIINPETVYFSVSADQTDVVKLKSGLAGEVILDAYPDEILNGTVKMVSFVPKTGETGTVYQVKVSIDKENSDYQFRYGMTGDANFVLSQKKNVITVPSTFIKTEKTKKYVWRLIENKKEKTFVKVGSEIDGSSEIVSGLNEGDTITN